MSTRGKATLAREVWMHIFDFIASTADQRDDLLERNALPPWGARALASLDPTEGRTMRSLADEWKCDASTATWMVDRLEQRGLVERRFSPTDRRLRLVVLTPSGRSTKARVYAGLYRPPPELLELGTAELASLRDAVSKLPAGRWPGPRPEHEPRRIRSR